MLEIIGWLILIALGLGAAALAVFVGGAALAVVVGALYTWGDKLTHRSPPGHP